ncbi:MAG: HAMP domain-containing histidine kinase [Actinobacteria bacterium]|nr:MAG: HAMP domain-containing histidine kinase [Actinomycetota bacterium]
MAAQGDARHWGVDMRRWEKILSKSSPRGAAFNELSIAPSAQAAPSSAGSIRALAAVVVKAARQTIGPSNADIRLIVPDRRGALRAIPSSPAPEEGSDVRACRRTAFAAGRHVRAELEPRTRTLAIFPVSVEDRTLALIEVVSSPSVIKRRWDLFETLAAMIAPAVAALEAVPAGPRSGRGRQGSGAATAVAHRHDLTAAWTAHEFKGPLVAVGTCLDYLLEPDRQVGPLERDLLARARNTVERLSGTVDSVLEWIAGVGTPAFEVVDLREVATDVVASTVEVPSDRIVVDAPTPVWVSGSSGLLRAAVANLVGNAANYSPAEGNVTVSVRRLDAKAIVRVDDDGPGVAQNEREAIGAGMDPVWGFSSRVKPSSVTAGGSGWSRTARGLLSASRSRSGRCRPYPRPNRR